MNLGILLISKKKIFQYVIIFLMIQYLGGRLLSAAGSNIFYGACLAISLFYLMRRKYLLKQDVGYFNFLKILMISLLVTFILTFGNLSIGTSLSLISRFLIVYVAIVVDRNKFLERFLNLVFFLSIISLVSYGMIIFFGQETLSPLLSKLYEVKNVNSWMNSSYGLFFFVFNFMDPTRNVSIFGEPGEYQMLINTALYLLIFKGETISAKVKNKYAIVFIITMVSIHSTSGFFNFMVLMLVSLLQSFKTVSPKIKRIFIFFIISALVYMFFIATENSFIYTKFLNKFITNENTIDFAIQTGADRVGSINSFTNLVLKTPLALVFGVGYEGLLKLNGEYYISGILNSIVMFGIITCIILYGYMIRNLLKYKRNYLEVVLVLFMSINMGLSQPDFLSIMTVLICCFGVLRREPPNRLECKLR